MKKLLYLILIIISFTGIKVKAYENDLEYLEITYEFIDENNYYVTYKFKPKEIRLDGKYYLDSNHMYSTSISHNVENFILENKDGLLDYKAFKMTFNLNEKIDYYIKYKGFIKDKNDALFQFKINPIYYYLDYLRTDSFKLTIVNPYYIGLTRDKVYFADNYLFVKDNNKFIFSALDDDGSLNNYKEIVFYPLDEDNIDEYNTNKFDFFKFVEIYNYIGIGIMAIIYAIVIIAILYTLIKSLIKKIKN
jgi:hypothetical protein